MKLRYLNAKRYVMFSSRARNTNARSNAALLKKEWPTLVADIFVFSLVIRC